MKVLLSGKLWDPQKLWYNITEVVRQTKPDFMGAMITLSCP
jgi:hypothetical protein